MSDIVYSHNEEEYWDEIDTPVKQIVDDPDLQLPARIHLWQAEKKSYAHSDFLSTWIVDMVIERMQDEAFDEAGEFSEIYLEDQIQPQSQEELRQAILAWVSKHFGDAVPFWTTIPGTERKISVMIDADGHADDSTIVVLE